MTQTLPLSIVLGRVHTGKLIGYTVLNLDRTEYAAFALATESSVLGTYFVSGGYEAPSEGGYLVVSESDGGDPAVLTALAEASIDGSGVTVQDIEDALSVIEEIVSNLNVSDVTYVAQSNAGYLTITIGRTFDEAVTNLIIPVDWEKTYFTVKNNREDDEADALLQLVVSNPPDSETDGVRRLNGVLWHEAVDDDEETEEDETDPEPYDRDLGSLTVTQATGRVDIYLTDELTVQLTTAKRIGWDVKFIDSNGDSTGWRGIVDMVKTETQTV